MWYSLFVVVISTLLVSYGIGAEESKGNSCSLSNDLLGECKRLENCPDAVRNVTTRKSPVMCDSLGLDLLVCCPIERTTNTDRTSSSIVTTQQSVSRVSTQCSNPGELAKQKCVEYSGTFPSEESWEWPVMDDKNKVVGGEKAKEQEFPHMTAIGFNSLTKGTVWLCGGTLVSANFVLTAAHCTYSAQYGSAARVKVGILNLVRDTELGRPQERLIIEKIRHPLYKKPSAYHDIALLRMESPIVFDAYVKPACLPTVNRAEGSVTATGWGVTDYLEEEGSSDLLKVVLKIVDQPSCNATYVGQTADPKLEYGIVDDWLICATGNGQQDTCSGDSGGPLSTYHRDHARMFHVVGITSFGRACAIVPGVYTRVYNYICWLESIIWQA